MDRSLIQPLPFPPRPDKLTNGFMVQALADIRRSIQVDNGRKAELLQELDDCGLITGQGRQQGKH